MRRILLAAATLVPACAADAVQEDGAGNGSAGLDDEDDAIDPGDPQAPRLEVLLTDAPAEFDEVWVNISSVEIEAPEQGWMTLTDQPQSFDLLTLRNDVTAALGGAQLAPGTYGQLRLVVDAAHVVAGDVVEDLAIASGGQTGIKINLDATLEADMVYTLVLDFDAARSIKSTGQGLLMTPVIQVDRFDGAPVPEPEPEAEPETETEEEPSGGVE